MPKITIAEAVAALTALGVKDVVIDETRPEEEAVATETILAEVDTAREPVYKTKFGQAMAEKAASEAVGKLTGSIRAVIKREAGIKEGDLATDAKIEEWLSKAFGSLKANKDATAEQVRQQMTDALAALTIEKDTAFAAKEKELTDTLQNIENSEIHKIIAKAVAKAPIPKGADTDMIAKLVRINLNERYKPIRKDEALELRDIKNPDVPVLRGSTVVTLDDEIKDNLTKMGVWQEDTRKEVPPKQTHVIGATTTASGLSGDLAALDAMINGQ